MPKGKSFSPYVRRPPAPNISSNTIPNRSPATNIRSTNVHESSLTDLQRFEAAFHAFCLNNQEINNTETHNHDETDGNPEELHAYMAQKAPKKSGNNANMKKKTPGNINRLLSPPRPNGDPN